MSEQEYLKQTLRSMFEQQLNERVNRYLSVNHQRLIGLHHFAYASSECLDAYRDGLFTCCIMATQAVNDGIIKFIAERNSIVRQERETNQALIQRIAAAGYVSQLLVDAACRIQGSFRNDFHHMNPTVSNVNLPVVAKQNILDLAEIEREIFGCDFDNGYLKPSHPKYWDTAPDGTVPVFVRCM
jgi:hypothetical protein